jgi:heavy metal sensor kinase
VFVRARFENALMSDANETVTEDSEAIHSHLMVGPTRARWVFNTADNEEAYFVRRLRRVLAIVDQDGKPLEVSPGYSALGLESADEVRALMAGPLPAMRLRSASDGSRFVLRSQLVFADGQRYLLTNGRSLKDSDELVTRLTWNYYLAILPLSALLAFLGWWLAGRGLDPLNAVAKTAQTVSTSNLARRIPMRGADDELDHLIASFNAMTDRLEISFKQLKHFSTDVSHELRTPMTTIRGQLEVALFTANTTEQYREAIINAIEGVERLSRVVTALLQLGAAETGQLAIRKERLDFGSLSSSVAAQYVEPADFQNLQLKIRAPANCFVEGDRTQLERLLNNLLSNAIKYTPAGGVVAIDVRREAGVVHLDVSDTGRGISADHLPHIFDRFYRVPDGASDPDRGLGLGLSFVAWIVKAHGGQLEVKSELGRGSLFRITLVAA